MSVVENILKKCQWHNHINEDSHVLLPSIIVMAPLSLISQCSFFVQYVRLLMVGGFDGKESLCVLGVGVDCLLCGRGGARTHTYRGGRDCDYWRRQYIIILYSILHSLNLDTVLQTNYFLPHLCNAQMLYFRDTIITQSYPMSTGLMFRA